MGTRWGTGPPVVHGPSMRSVGLAPVRRTRPEPTACPGADSLGALNVDINDVQMPEVVLAHSEAPKVVLDGTTLAPVTLTYEVTIQAGGHSLVMTSTTDRTNPRDHDGEGGVASRNHRRVADGQCHGHRVAAGERLDAGAAYHPARAHDCEGRFRWRCHNRRDADVWRIHALRGAR